MAEKGRQSCGTTSISAFKSTRPMPIESPRTAVSESAVDIDRVFLTKFITSSKFSEGSGVDEYTRAARHEIHRCKRIRGCVEMSTKAGSEDKGFLAMGGSQERAWVARKTDCARTVTGIIESLSHIRHLIHWVRCG